MNPVPPSDWSPDNVIKLRHALHRNPRLSGFESETAGRIARFFEPLQPDSMVDGLGGTGIAFEFNGQADGPTVMLRCELDALPIHEESGPEYRSVCAGVSHKCGHDGHMAILAAVGQRLSIQRPARGRVILLYQPAEETGQGAAAVIRDPKFASIRPDFVFALHNLPGFPLGQIVIRPGTFNCASRGIAIRFVGRTAHAAQPETGRSPATAMCLMISGLSGLPSEIASAGEVAFATVVGARMGERSFGTAPDTAEVWATLRSETDQTMNRMIDHVRQMTDRTANAQGLKSEITFEDIFSSTVNAPEAVRIVRAAAGSDPVFDPGRPFRWSEDFGQFTAIATAALFGLGAGTDIPDLHNPDYDFADQLIVPASDLFLRIIDKCLGASSLR